MFDFMSMLGNYEDRVVGRFDEGDVSVSTAAVTDGRKPYETAVRHPWYNSGKWVIVSCYDSVEEAQVGHDEWVGIMTAECLPDELRDCANSWCSQMLDAWNSESMVFKRVEP